MQFLYLKAVLFIQIIWSHTRPLIELKSLLSKDLVPSNILWFFSVSTQVASKITTEEFSRRSCLLIILIKRLCHTRDRQYRIPVFFWFFANKTLNFHLIVINLGFPKAELSGLNNHVSKFPVTPIGVAQCYFKVEGPRVNFT